MCCSAMGKTPDDAFDRLRRVDGVQRGKHQVAGFGGLHGDLDGFAVAHFAHQNHLGRLPQRGPQCEREAGRIAVQLALMNDAVLVTMQELDGIFDGEHVVELLLIDLVDDCGQRGRLAGTGRPGDQHDSVAQVHDLPQLSGQVQRFEVRNLGGNYAHDNGTGCHAA